MKINCSNLTHKLLALAICFLLFAGRGFSQTGILVTYYDGSEQNYSLAASGKLYFENNSLMITANDATTPTSIPLAIIRKITFSSAVLPLQLVEFTIRNEKAQVTLIWRTENEVNTAYFVIERSADGASYQSVGQVAASNSTTSSNYSFADQAPKSGIGYYRLKQVDADGKYVYSKILTLNRTASANTILLPNPATDYFSINSTTSARLNVKIYSMAGRLMVSGNYAPGEQIAISKLTSGMYVAIINNKPYKLIKK